MSLSQKIDKAVESVHNFQLAEQEAEQSLSHLLKDHDLKIYCYAEIFEDANGRRSLRESRFRLTKTAVAMEGSRKYPHHQKDGTYLSASIIEISQPKKHQLLEALTAKASE